MTTLKDKFKKGYSARAKLEAKSEGKIRDSRDVYLSPFKIRFTYVFLKLIKSASTRLRVIKT